MYIYFIIVIPGSQGATIKTKTIINQVSPCTFMIKFFPNSEI